MLKYGGYSLLIAAVATISFFAVLQWANDYVKEKTGDNIPFLLLYFLFVL